MGIEKLPLKEFESIQDTVASYRLFGLLKYKQHKLKFTITLKKLFQERRPELPRSFQTQRLSRLSSRKQKDPSRFFLGYNSAYIADVRFEKSVAENAKKAKESQRSPRFAAGFENVQRKRRYAEFHGWSFFRVDKILPNILN